MARDWARGAERLETYLGRAWGDAGRYWEFSVGAGKFQTSK